MNTMLDEDAALAVRALVMRAGIPVDPDNALLATDPPPRPQRRTRRGGLRQYVYARISDHRGCYIASATEHELNLEYRSPGTLRMPSREHGVPLLAEHQWDQHLGWACAVIPGHDATWAVMRVAHPTWSAGVVDGSVPTGVSIGGAQPEPRVLTRTISGDRVITLTVQDQVSHLTEVSLCADPKSPTCHVIGHELLDSDEVARIRLQYEAPVARDHDALRRDTSISPGGKLRWFSQAPDHAPAPVRSASPNGWVAFPGQTIDPRDTYAVRRGPVKLGGQIVRVQP